MAIRSLFTSPRRAALALGSLALIVRVIAIFVVFGDQFYFSDEANYFREAEYITHGHWMGSSTGVAPGPAYFIATGLKLGLDRTGLRLVQAVLGALAVMLTVRLGSRMFGLRVGILAGAVAAFYPYLLYISGVFYTQNQVIPLLLFIVYALYRRQARGGRGWIVGAGASIGLAGCFMVPSLLIAPVLGVWHILRSRARRRAIWDVGLMAVVSLLVILPVTYRNYRLDHRFVLIASMGGRSFYSANNPDYDPSDRDVEGWIETNVVRVEKERVDRGWTQAQMDSALSSRAREYVRENPKRFIENYLKRAGNMWSPTPHPWSSNAHTGSRQFLIARLTSTPVIFLAVLGALLFVSRWRLLFPFYALPLIFTLTFSLFNTTVRYRLTFEPFLLILAAAGVVRLVWPRGIGGWVGSRLAAQNPDPPGV